MKKWQNTRLPGLARPPRLRVCPKVITARLPRSHGSQCTLGIVVPACENLRMHRPLPASARAGDFLYEPLTAAPGS